MNRRRDPATSGEFRGQEEELARDDAEEGKEDVSNEEDVEARKDTETPQQDLRSDTNKQGDVKESDEEEEQSGKTRGESTTPGANTDREPEREESSMRRPRHVPEGTWLHTITIKLLQKIEGLNKYEAELVLMRGYLLPCDEDELDEVQTIKKSKEML
ncbi:hypothetical protein NDU88_003114 [Pleurodeles waltl]|uniref:Uncharacterized protein n=1 Tax=Pleurodeles waltl TaxID=8319 RepID=A0AAV7P949_PLEWA|nr:hypothetical protein NDU88_003114 [Pleurodeles waltl]